MADGQRLTVQFKDAATYNASGKAETYAVDVYKSTVDDFLKAWHYAAGQTIEPNRWLGVPLLQYPTDLFITQEIMTELRPDLVLECGTFQGGLTLYLATILDALQCGRVITIDIEARQWPSHPRITYVTGSSTDPGIVRSVQDIGSACGSVLVILDSDHREPHVMAELMAYAGMADYLIVQDTNINGHPVRPNFGPGPWEAVEKFLRVHPEWQRDTDRERLWLTACPAGYLKRA